MRKLGTAVVIVISLVGAMVGVQAGVAQADPTPVTFRPRVEFPLYGGTAVALGDLNGDTILDLVTNGSALLGDGAGGFGAPIAYTAGSFSLSVALGDLDGDTVLDLVTANYFDGNLSVLLGDGAGGFGAKTDFPVGTEPASVAVGDVNGDTFLDLAAANQGSDSLSVLLGDGAGGFGAKTDFATSGLPRSVALADLNGDGALDLAAGSIGGGSVSVLLGDGAGGFGAKNDFAASIPYFVTVGDVNGDTFPDLATANSEYGSVSILLGDGTGAFGPNNDLTTGEAPGTVALGDLNGDTFLDVIAADYQLNILSVLLGDGTGGFGPKTDFVSPGAYGVGLGDLNGDARPDVAVTHDASVSVFVNTTGIPATVPGAPTIGTAIAGVGQATVSWTPPADDGNAAVSEYVVTPYIGAVAQPPVAFGPTVTTHTLTGLANGTTYTFTVAATNSVGTGPESDHSNTVTPMATVPGAPTIVKNATAGNREATVSWTAPASDGGSAITGYVVTPYVGFFPLAPLTFASTATTQTISGLTNGTQYRFRVQAINAVGTSAFSKVTNPVTPHAVIVVTPDAGLLDGQTVAVEGFDWQPGHAIGFCQSVVAGSPGPGSCADGLYTQVTADSSGHFSGSLTLQRSIFVPDLGQFDCASPPQSCVVGAADVADVVGTVVAAPLSFATAPGVPTIIKNATAGNSEATVSWTAPASDGGSAITGYVVTPYVGFFPLAPRTFLSTATTQTISGLANGTEYRFRVQAINALGTSGYSKVTNPVTPAP